MKLSVLCAYALLALSLSGCEAMNKVGENFKAIKMPDMGLGQATANPSADGKANGLMASAGADCPQVKGLPELSSLSQFANPKETTAAKLIAETKLDNIGAACQVAPNSVTVELSLDFMGTLGPVGVKDLNGQANYTYPYFLTVITPDGQILSKDVFALSMVYDNGQITVRKQDKLRQVIPLGSGQTASQYQIVIGFQLSEDELVYNRTKK